MEAYDQSRKVSGKSSRLAPVNSDWTSLLAINRRLARALVEETYECLVPLDQRFSVFKRRRLNFGALLVHSSVQMG